MLHRFHPWQRSLSVSTRTSLALAAVLALVVTAMATIGFHEERADAIDASIDRLDRHNMEVVAELEHRFDRIAQTQARATQLFRAEREALDNASARRMFERLFPRQPDGTRRSTEAMFSGGNGPLGLTRGMAAFIPAGFERDPDAVRDFVAATLAVRALGEGSLFEVESLYYFTPGNALVIFAPKRQDRLSFYRKGAGADFNFQDREFARVATRTVNPARAMRCTSLQSLISMQHKQVWTTGCMTPVDRDGRHIGTFGTSMPLDQLVKPGNYQHTASEQIVIVSREGRLIHHPGYIRQNSAETRQYLDLSRAREPRLQALWALVQQHGSSGYNGHVEALDAMVAMRAIPSTGWYALTLEPEGVVRALAFRSIPRAGWTALLALVFSVLTVTLLLRQLVGKPLQKLTDDAQRIIGDLAEDEMIVLPETTSGNEVTRLVRKFETMGNAIRHSHEMLEQRVAERTMALNEANARLRDLSEIDALTAIANRRKILGDLDQRMTRMRPDSAMAVLLLDIDNFKAINDRYGHIAGDDALRSLAERMQALLRPGDALGRMGGEEFLIILDRARPVIADAIAERVRAAIAGQKFEVHGQIALPITVSIGVASWRPGDTVKALYARADGALYAAKTAGRNCVVTSNDRSLRHRNAA